MSDYIYKLGLEVYQRLALGDEEINEETFLALFQGMAFTAVLSTNGSREAISDFFSGISEQLTEAAYEVRESTIRVLASGEDQKPKKPNRFRVVN